MNQILQTYTSYNLWANTELIDVLKKIEPALLDKEIISSFSSLRKTVQHIWGAEEIWYKRLHGETITSMPEPENDFSEFSKIFLARSQSFIDLVNSNDESYFLTTCPYKDTKGNSQSNIPWQMIHHCMNHSTYHRGQLVTIMRENGVTPIPATDMIVYFRKIEKK